MKVQAALECMEENKGWFVGEGWAPIVMAALKDIATVDPALEIYQIKEKFGGLRLYCEGDGDKTIAGIIELAEKKAYETCEYCGAPGVLDQSQYWIKTLCSECQLKRAKDLVERMNP